MEQYIGPIVICLVSAVISCLILVLLDRSELKKESMRMTMVFMLLYMGIVSGMKLFLGDGEKTIFQSFWDIEYRTYIHYGIPILIISIIVPFVWRWIFKDRLASFAIWFHSIVLVAWILSFVIWGKVTNAICCMTVVAGAVVALAFAFWKKSQGKIETSEKAEIFFSLKVVLFYVFSVYIFNPSELFLNNITEFPVAYSSFITVLVIGGLCMIVVYMFATTYFMNKICCMICNYTIFILTIAGYLQGMFFNGKMLALDGTRQEWSQGKMIANICVWVAILVAVLVLKRCNQKADKYVGLVCIYITLIQLVTLGTMCITTEFPSEEEACALTTEAELELHPENNVIVFILDWYDEQILERIVEEDSTFIEPLADFTWYQNATSNYAFTAMSLPYFLTDVEWEYDMPETEYCQYAYEKGHFLQDIAGYNYDIGIYTETQYVDPSVQDLVINYSDDIERKCKFLDTISLMGQCSKYKLAPFIVKNMYWYATSDMIETMENSNIYLDDNYSFYQTLVQNKVQINQDSDKNGAFRFYHLDGAHAPCTMTEEFEKVKETERLSQAKGSMKIVYEYISQLKALGIYDDATIIITADHGQNTMLDDKDNLEGFDTTSNPILLLKEKNQTEGGISKAQVSHKEFSATVMQAIAGADVATYGRSFKQISESEEREREFIYRRHDDIPYRRYLIHGDVRNMENWTLAEDMR